MHPSTAKNCSTTYHYELSPERKLLAAVLQRAINDILAVADIEMDHRQSAHDWILADAKEPFTFEWTCEFLYLDANEIRKFVKQQMQ